MASHKRFRRVLAVAYIAEGDTEEEADDEMVALMDRVNTEYQNGNRVRVELGFQVLLDTDPGSGPGQIRVANIVLYGRGDHHNDND